MEKAITISYIIIHIGEFYSETSSKKSCMYCIRCHIKLQAVALCVWYDHYLLRSCDKFEKFSEKMNYAHVFMSPYCALNVCYHIMRKKILIKESEKIYTEREGWNMFMRTMGTPLQVV